MTAAYRLKGGGWLLATVVIALGFYLVSLRVAEERKRLEAVDARIVSAQRDIRALETEFDTRANLVQLERWNGDTLALAAPTAAQFVRDGRQLAAIDINAPSVRTAALVVPAIAAPVAPIPAAMLANVPAAPPVAAPAPVPAMVRVAVLRLDPAARAPAKVAVASPAPTHVPILARLDLAARAGAAVARVRPQAVAMLDDKLLSDATLGDLLARAKREARR